jgi:CHASE3 domain sensor protein
METSQRAYLFTGRDDYHDDFRKMERALPALIDETAKLVAGSPRQHKTFAGLRQVLVEKFTKCALQSTRSTAGTLKPGVLSSLPKLVSG